MVKQGNGSWLTDRTTCIDMIELMKIDSWVRIGPIKDYIAEHTHTHTHTHTQTHTHTHDSDEISINKHKASTIFWILILLKG